MNSITVGGSKGHIVETIMEGSSLFQLYSHYRWKMISNCTGRYTCRDHSTTDIQPLELIQNAGIIEITDESSSILRINNNNDDSNDSDNKKVSYLKQWEFTLPGRPDRLIVVPLDQQNTMGVITYEKLKNNPKEEESTNNNNNNNETYFCYKKYVHTLNTKSGFRRKLNAVGIEVTDDSIHLNIS